MSSRNRKTRSSDERNRNRHNIQAVTPVPQIYPSAPGYPVPAPQWFSPHLHANYPYSWYQPWQNNHPFNVENSHWVPKTTGSETTAITAPKSGLPGSDELMVDSLRRIYNNDNGSIEIERVKVQRRQGVYETKQNAIDQSRGVVSPKQCNSLVPVAPGIMGEVVAPPRKHKKRTKGTIFASPIQHASNEPQGWYPYMPYLPQPYPYPYAYGYMWPPLNTASTIGMSPHCQSPTDESDSSLCRQETLPSSISRNLESQSEPLDTKSGSPDLQRPSSSAAGSQITESLGTDIAPSDSVSMRGYRKDDSIEQILKDSFSKPEQDEPASESFQSNDMEKTKEWMQDMQRVFASRLETQSESAGDRSSFATACSDIPTPPTRKNKLRKSFESTSLTHKKSNSESNIDSQEEQGSLASLPFLNNTRVSDGDLIYAFKKLEQSADTFKSHASEHSKNTASKETLESASQEGPMKRANKGSRIKEDLDDRESRSSTMSFHSTRQSTEERQIDTDSTDIALPVDTSTADESADNIGSELLPSEEVEDNYKWILQNPGEVQGINHQNVQGEEEEEDDMMTNWRAEVSLWRARLVVSLCRGQGLDQQDWGTFQLLVQHPLMMDSKLSLLHARRLCCRNCDIGVSMLRNTLLYLTTYGETLMKPEEERSPGWKSLTIDSNLPWTPIKGSMEILHVFGFRLREDGTLRYRRKCAPEVSVIARLTLDILVLAEEFRLYLTGTHQYPTNITQLFHPICDSRNGEIYVPNNNSRQRSPEKEKITFSNENSFRDTTLVTTEQCLVDNTDHSSSPQELQIMDSKEKLESKKRLAPQPPIEPNPNSPTAISDETKSMAILPSSISPEIVDNHSGRSSLPDLQSPSPLLLSPVDPKEDKFSENDETLSPPLTPVNVINTTQIENEAAEHIENDKEVDKTGDEIKQKKLKKVGIGDNPEDHIYEEIGDIKSQVETLKESGELGKIIPPPLPPKTKSLYCSDLSTPDAYPQVDWSVGSQYSSVGGSTSSRKKKRKAPMPPSFMSSNVNDDDEENERERQIFSDHDQRELSEDKFQKKETPHSTEKSLNPFYEEKILPSGFIGKNPFYEDIERKLPPFENKLVINKETDLQLKVSSQSTSDASQKEDDTSQATDEEISETTDSSGSAKTIVRPQRRKIKVSIKQSTPKSNVTEQPKRAESGDQSSHEEKSSGTESQTSSVVTIKDSAPASLNQLRIDEETMNNDVGKPHVIPPLENNAVNEIHSEKKNLKKEQQCDSRVVASNSNLETESIDKSKGKTAGKNEIIIQEISIKYDISIVEPEDFVLKVDEHKVNKAKTNVKNEEKFDESSENPKQIELNKKENSLFHKVNIDNSQQDKLSPENSLVILPQLLSPKTPLKLLEDIPYIDINDVKNYKDNYNLSKTQNSFCYEKPQKSIENSSAHFSTCDRSKRHSAFLLQGLTSVPYIDDTDAPPDCPPPPIPTSSPPETPHNSPPETPHISPPPSPIFFLEPESDDNKSTTPLDETQRRSLEREANLDAVKKLLDNDFQINDTMQASNITDDSVDQDKSTVLFESKCKSRTPEPYSKATLDNDRYEIPESLKIVDTFEERYEIPDVVRSDAQLKMKNISLSQKVSETNNNNKKEIATLPPLTKNPKRPPRHIHPTKIPPRPPKLYYKEIPPPLPPKAASLKSSLDLSNSSSSVSSNKVLNTSSSLPSTLAKSKPLSNKVIIPAPLAIPKAITSSSTTRSTTSKSVIISAKSSSLSSLPAGTYPRGIIVSHPHSISHPLPQSSTSLPQTTYPAAKSASTPSSPRFSLNRNKKLTKGDKKQISWPSVFCDCVHPHGGNKENDEIKNVI